MDHLGNRVEVSLLDLSCLAYTRVQDTHLAVMEPIDPSMHGKILREEGEKGEVKRRGREEDR